MAITTSTNETLSKKELTGEGLATVLHLIKLYIDGEISNLDLADLLGNTLQEKADKTDLTFRLGSRDDNIKSKFGVLESINSCEIAGGYYNKSNKDTSTGNTEWTWSGDKTAFSIGNGDSNGTRHNAIDIRQDGSIYIADTSYQGDPWDAPMINLQDSVKIEQYSAQEIEDMFK